MNKAQETLLNDLPEFSKVKDLIDAGITDLEIRLLSVVMSVAALPEASTIDNFEAKRLLDVVIRDARNALELELTLKHKKFQNILATHRGQWAGGMDAGAVNSSIRQHVNLLHEQAMKLDGLEREDADYAIGLLKAYSAKITASSRPELKFTQVI